MTNGTTFVESAQGKCEVLVSHFASSFTGSGSSTSPDSPSIVCESGDVYKAISSLPCDPNDVSSRMLKGTTDVIF